MCESELLTRGIMVPLPGPHGTVTRFVPLPTWVASCELRLREQLGLIEESELPGLLRGPLTL